MQSVDYRLFCFPHCREHFLHMAADFDFGEDAGEFAGGVEAVVGGLTWGNARP